MRRIADLFETSAAVLCGVLFVVIPVVFWVDVWRTHSWPNGDPAETAVYSAGICVWTIADVVLLVLFARHQLGKWRNARRNGLWL